MGRGGSLLDSSPFVRRVAGSNPALAATQGPWASPSLTVASGASEWNSDKRAVQGRQSWGLGGRDTRRFWARGHGRKEQRRAPGQTFIKKVHFPSGASIPLRQWCIPPCYRLALFPKQFWHSVENFPDSTFSEKYFRFSSAKISDDLYFFLVVDYTFWNDGILLVVDFFTKIVSI